MNKPIRILQIGMHDKIGGVETYLMNYYRNIDKSKIKIPNSINVSIEYLQSEGSINIDDIKLYIDLNEVSLEDNTCKIKYESIYEIEKINIDPDIVTIEES